MKLKTFSDEGRSGLEEEVNQWLDDYKDQIKIIFFEPKMFFNSYKKKWYAWIWYDLKK